VNAFLNSLKKYLLLMSLGALAGIGICSWLVPGLLQQRVAPVGAGKPFSCEVDVRWAATTLVQAQLATPAGQG